MLGEFSQFFRIFRACCAHLTSSCYFVKISDDLLLISDGFWQVRGRFWDAPGHYLRRFGVHVRLCGRNALHVADKTTVLVGRNILRKQRAQCNKS